MVFVLTEDHLSDARRRGGVHARAEIELGVNPSSALEFSLDEEDIRSLAFRVTGEKLDPGSDDAAFIAQAYLDEYLDTWEDSLNE